MIKAIVSKTKGYRLVSVLSPLMILIEVLMEVQLPFVMSDMVNTGIQGGAGMDYIVRRGVKMILMAVASLVSGSLAARFAAKAGMGFGSNIREAVFAKIQSFSFSNIDRFSTASLVTRMTTDVNTMQMAYTMALRIVLRAPLLFVMSFIYAHRINAPPCEDIPHSYPVSADIPRHYGQHRPAEVQADDEEIRRAEFLGAGKPHSHESYQSVCQSAV